MDVRVFYGGFLRSMVYILTLIFTASYSYGYDFVELMPFIKPSYRSYSEEQFGVQVSAWRVADDVVIQAFGEKSKYLGNVLPVCFEIINTSPVAINLDKSVVYGDRVPFKIIRELTDNRTFLSAPASAGVMGFVSFVIISVMFRTKLETFFSSVETYLPMFPLREYADQLIFYAGLASVVIPSCVMAAYVYRDYKGLDKIKHMFELEGILIPGGTQNTIMFFDLDFVRNHNGVALTIDNNLGKELDFKIPFVI